MNTIIQENKSKLNKMFQSHKIKNAYVFGSALGDEFNENSDIDLLINFEENIEPLERGDLWWSLYENLQDLFHRKIDLITEASLKNKYFIQELNNTKVLIYIT